MMQRTGLKIAILVFIFLSLASKSRSTFRPSEVTRQLIATLENEERADDSPPLSYRRIHRANKLYKLRILEQSQNQTEQRIQQFLVESRIVQCLPLWQLRKMREDLAAAKLKLLFKKHRHKQKKRLKGGAAAGRNGTQSADNSSEDSDELEEDDNQTEEDDSESPTDDSNQSSDDDSEGDPDDS
ncbi:glutamic acid-rich protein-like [Neocloeon triangulifer]|uniref:glutamic acid-rich protein-like n=1 Tax=Neocloeon triangulifer TaxID=2078957 RepID=UPI00286F959C|nr:glutamic acid-rich protein-like [Neocloeon triangulifer]